MHRPRLIRAPAAIALVRYLTAFAVLGVTAGAALPARPTYRDGPPPGHTGGFGQPSCRLCHFDQPLNAPGGLLRITGLPERGYLPGRRYALTIEITRPGTARAGFQLAARQVETGVSVGRLFPHNARVQIVTDSAGIRYAEHTEQGTQLEDPNRARWGFDWQAPTAPAGAVWFHVAGNAANDDASEFGDFIMTDSACVRPQAASGR